MNEFLTKDLLAQADPENEPDRDIKLRTVLDRASANTENRFADQPLVKAAIHKTLGDTYLGLGENEEAERHYEKARRSIRASWVRNIPAPLVRSTIWPSPCSPPAG